MDRTVMSYVAVKTDFKFNEWLEKKKRALGEVPMGDMR